LPCCGWSKAPAAQAMRSAVASNVKQQVSAVAEELHSALLAAGDPLSPCARSLQACTKCLAPSVHCLVCKRSEVRGYML